MDRDSIPASRLYNRDLAPAADAAKTWGLWHFAALWVGIAVCIPTYTLAAGMITQGMTWWQALLTVTLGNLIVVVPIVLNAHAGTRYGIPFPVLLRSSFGVWGANIPALMRGLVACGWFGIQTWIGGSAIYVLFSVLFGFQAAGPADAIPGLGLSAGQFGCFLLFWALNLFVVLRGIETLKWLETWAAPFLLAIGLGLLYWGVSTAGGFGVVLSDEVVAKIRGGAATDFEFWAVFWPNLTAMVAFWATLALNIPDFTRFARSQRDQVLGQLIGLPTAMALFAFIGIAVTASTVVIFGEAIWDPVQLIGRFPQAWVVAFALFALSLATLSTNLAANVVSPANDFSNLWPRVIDFRRGGIITCVIGVLIMPWRLYNDLAAYVFTWLIGYGALLGSICGVMLADYHLLRRRQLDVDDLYREDGAYSFRNGFNWRALVALAAGIVPNVPGFISQVSQGAVSVPGFFMEVYTHAWFVSLGVAAAVHWLLGVLSPPQTPADPR
ncbi:MAG: NCS1 family nucleobase:cation symporter-1 [Acidobacteriota bacterium]